MGTSAYVHVGPYIECQFELSGRIVTVHACPNNSCRRYQERTETNYCPVCGAKITDVSVDTQEAPSTADISEEIDEVLRDVQDEERSNLHIWIENVGGKNLREYEVDLMEAGEQDLTELDISEEIVQFRAAFAKELAVLERYYGEENVTVKWGIVVYVY